MTTRTPIDTLGILYRAAHTVVLATWGTTRAEGLIELGAGDPVLILARALAEARAVLDREAEYGAYLRSPLDPRD